MVLPRARPRDAHCRRPPLRSRPSLLRNLRQGSSQSAPAAAHYLIRASARATARPPEATESAESPTMIPATASAESPTMSRATGSLASPTMSPATASAESVLTKRVTESHGQAPMKGARPAAAPPQLAQRWRAEPAASPRPSRSPRRPTLYAWVFSSHGRGGPVKLMTTRSSQRIAARYSAICGSGNVSDATPARTAAPGIP
jgi:hypothetical protein